MTLQLRSYSSVFELERRIYRIDSLQLNPAGVPVRSLAWFAGAALAGLAAGRVPLLGLLPWYLRELIAPVFVSASMTFAKIDGRPAHSVLRTILAPAPGGLHVRRSWAPCRPVRWRPPPVVLLPDGRSRHAAGLRYHGPGRVTVAAAHSWRAAAPGRSRRSELELTADPGRPVRRRVLVIGDGGRVRLPGRAG